MFCPKCGSILMPKKVDGKRVMQCSCGHTSAGGDMKIREHIEATKDFEVIEEQIETLPITDEKCPKCKFGQAYFFTKQTRSADEPETKFLRCKKCNHQWRDYS
jgi:transcription factor S